MKWFKEKEFACRCCGELPPLARANVRALVENVLDPVREKLGRPIVVNSGYRCPKHNLEVGGVGRSQHLCGEAADIALVHGEGFMVQDLVDAIRENGKFDQMIVYPGLTSSTSDATQDSSSKLGSPSLLPRFVHVSWKRNGGNRQQILRSLGNGRYQTVSREEILHGKTAQHTTERRVVV